tara:strand:- start:61 stop:312 length:252 start_codon:yes stop_codon:yes gene_type:complete
MDKINQIIKTDNDSWDCIPELKQYVECYEDDLGHLIYEIKMCKREMDLHDMIWELKVHTQELNRIVKDMDMKYFGYEIINCEP